MTLGDNVGRVSTSDRTLESRTALLLEYTITFVEQKFENNSYGTLKEHQWIRTFAIFQRILISMAPYEISIFFPSK